MKSLESFIENHRQRIFRNTSPTSIYYIEFGDDTNDDKNTLPYGDECIDAKEETIDEEYIEALDSYIVVEIVLNDKDCIPVVEKVKNP